MNLMKTNELKVLNCIQKIKAITFSSKEIREAIRQALKLIWKTCHIWWATRNLITA